MIHLRSLLVFVLCTCCIPISSYAQSHWLHKSAYGIGAYGYGSIAAVDSVTSVLITGGPEAAFTQDYWQSLNYIFIDTSWRQIEYEYSVAGFGFLSHRQLILGCNAPVLKPNKRDSVQPFSPGGHIIRSMNAGKTWTDLALNSFDTTKLLNRIVAMAALDSGHLAILIDSNDDSRTDHILLSSDGGLTWQSISSPPFNYWSSQTGFPPNPVLSYIKPSTFVVAAMQQYGNSTIYRSTDLGTTWDSGFVANKVITKFAFINPRIGFASGALYDLSAQTATAIIDKTTDGGVTWSNIYSKYVSAAAAALSIAFADSLHGLACGGAGLILQTTDGGATWSQMISDYTADAEGNDLLSDVAYPDTNHAMIASSDGSVLVYQPNGNLSLPNITYPLFSTPATPRTFDVTWDPVPGATRYWIRITGSILHINDTVVVDDSNVMATSYHLSDLLDRTPTANGVQYEISLQAFNATNESNVAHRSFIVYRGTNGVIVVPNAQDSAVAVYPDPATNWLSVMGFKGAVAVLDGLGRTRNCPMHNGKLDISLLPAGIYYVSDGRHRAKFVKQ